MSVNGYISGSLSRHERILNISVASNAFER